RFVAHCVRLALGIASHEIGVDLFHLLGHQAELRDAIWVKLVLVAEGDRLERQNRFARLVHWFDCVLETLRGDYRAQVTIRVDNHPYTSSDGHSTDASDIGVRVSAYVADANSIALGRNTEVADVGIVIARGEISTGSSAQCDIAAAGCVASERIKTAGRVGLALCVAIERQNTVGRIGAAGFVEIERSSTDGR